MSPVGDCAKSQHGPIGLWDVSRVTDMSYLFRGAERFNQSISNWDVSSVTNMRYMFSDAKSFNQDVSKWDVSSVISMRSMFSGASFFNQDILGVKMWRNKIKGSYYDRSLGFNPKCIP